VTRTNNPNATDKTLVAQILRGDHQAFGLLIKNTEKLVAGIVFKMIQIPEDRKDLAQDIYLKVYKNLPGFQFQSKLSTWIAQITYNTCLDYLRKKNIILIVDQIQSNDPEDEGEDIITQYTGNHGNFVDDVVLLKDRANILKSAIRRLPPLYNTLISLYHKESLSYDEIGQITGLPAGTVKNYLFRARKILKNDLLQKYQKDDL
jgi:RNA polymerase sigma-70 factor (ECF subfamily)